MCASDLATTLTIPRDATVDALYANVHAIWRQLQSTAKLAETPRDVLVQKRDELRAALAKAGKPVSEEEAEQILSRVDANNDGQISLEEFRAVFALAPAAVPDGLKPLFDVGNLLLDGLSSVTEVLGIEVAGQWRTTGRGQRYVDDVIGEGAVLMPGDVAQVHYTLTLLSTGQVVETSQIGRAHV